MVSCYSNRHSTTGVEERVKVAVAYIDGHLVIVIWEQYREFFRAKCAREDFEKLEVFLYE